MPSPFPGMNPYFEQADHWQDFQAEFLTRLRRQLAAQIRPDCIILLDKHVYIHDLPAEPRRSPGRPKLEVPEAPAEILISAQDVERFAFLEIRDRKGRELVTVIELLSPSNKRPGEDRQQYLAKRGEILKSTAHLVEIDLLRGWTPMPADGRPDGDYSVLVSRAGRRPAADFWPIRLRERLPVIPIPLRPADPDGRVDLQEVLHQAYDGPGYENFIYSRPPEPPLSAEDAGWAGQFLPGNPG